MILAGCSAYWFAPAPRPGLAAISAKAGTRVELVLPLLIILLSLGGSTFGMSEEALPLYAVLLPLLFRQAMIR